MMPRFAASPMTGDAGEFGPVARNDARRRLVGGSALLRTPAT